MFCQVIFVRIALALQLVISTTRSHETNHEKRAFQAGDIILGGLFPVHTYCPTGCEDHCGALRSHDVIFFTEAMIYAIDAVNNDSSILPGVTLGYEILDYCSKDVIALEKASHFIHSCTRDQSSPIVGVVGPYSSSVALQVSNLLGLFKVPHISYGATSPLLSDKSRFKYFTRTVPSDKVRAQAMVDLLLKNDTKYVSVVYSDDEFGREGNKYFTQEAESGGICIGVVKGIPRDFLYSTFEEIVKDLSDKQNAGVVVLFCSKRDISRLFEAVKTQQKQGVFRWLVGGDSAEMSVYLNGNEDMAKDMIICSPWNEKATDFEKWMSENNRSRNPWVTEMHLHTNVSAEDSVSFVTEKGEKFAAEAYIQNVINSVFTFVNALNRIYSVFCKNVSDPLSCFLIKSMDREAMLQAIHHTVFHTPNGRQIKFDNNGDILPKYDLLRPKKDTSGTWGFEKVGQWSPVEDVPGPSPVMLFEDKDILPQTFCSLPCKTGEIKIAIESCCWKCYPCKANEITGKQQTECTPCVKGFVPDVNKTQCLQLPVVNVDPCWAFVLFNASLSGAGVVCTLLTLMVFIILHTHPIIKASSRGLSCVLLAGVVISYSESFLDLITPDQLVCSLRGYTSIGHVMCYIVMFSKTLRVNRLFNSSLRKSINPTFVSTRSQLGIIGVILGFTVIFSTAWGFYKYSNSVLMIYTAEHVIVQCYITELGVGIVNTFYLSLLSLCAVYTFKTRKLPRKFRETKGLAVAIYMAATLHLIVLSIVFTMSEESLIRGRAINLSHPLVASAVLLPIFSPKLYSIFCGSKKEISINTGTRNEAFQNDKDETGAVSLRPTWSLSDSSRLSPNSRTGRRLYVMPDDDRSHAESLEALSEDSRSRATSTDTLRSSVGVTEQEVGNERERFNTTYEDKAQQFIYTTWL